MRKPTAAILLLVGMLLGSLVGCHHDEGGGQDNDPHKKRALNPPKEPGKRPQGMQALAVKQGAAQPFTKQDVINYFKTHNLALSSGPMDQIKVESLEFITSAEVTKRLQGAPTGLKDGEPIGFVTLSGIFVFSEPPKAKPVIFRKAYAAFDAVSGNLLMDGSLDRAAEQPEGTPK
jgi:hypothetical protein